MFTISQKRIGTRNVYFRVETDVAGIPIRQEPFDCRIKKRKEDGKTIYIPLDRVGNIRHEVFRYLNTTSKYNKHYTREQKSKALNLFYIFCDIMEYDPSRLTRPQIKELVDFLYGVSVKNVSPEHPHTIRSSATVSNYYGAIKAYIIDNDWNTKPFENYKTFTLETTIGDVTFAMKHHKDSNLPRGDTFSKTTAPMHLTPEQAKAFIDVAKKDDVKAILIIIRLQLGHGLRIGEALGITKEDIKRVIKKNGKVRHYIVLRNRVSDAPDQFCKELYHPYDVSEYKQSVYVGAETWEIDITEDFYNEITTYYHSTREGKMTAKRRARMLKETRADSVEESTMFSTEENFYIFVGRNGRRLTAQTYNNHLHKLFAQIDIESDRLTRQNNCSHKLRHTYAMFLAQYLDVPATRVQLRDLMRHTSVLSSEPYYTPTEEDTMMMKERFMKSLKGLVPDLFDTNN